MDEFSETELFSAYLDGELTAEEQVRVEQILATSPAARQLMEELRALDNTLQGLPTEKLDEDLSARVLAVAERRMLLPNDAPDSPSAGRAAETLTASDTESIGWLGIPWREISWRGMLSKRALAWTAVVLVAALIIKFTYPPSPNRQIAKGDKPGTIAPLTVTIETRSAKSTANVNWDVPAGQPRVLKTEKLASADANRKAVDSKNLAGNVLAEGAVLEKAKAADKSIAANERETGAESKDVGAKKMSAQDKAAEPAGALADSRPAPAAAPMPEKPEAAALVPSEQSRMDVAKRVADAPALARAMKAPAAPSVIPSPAPSAPPAAMAATKGEQRAGEDAKRMTGKAAAKKDGVAMQDLVPGVAPGQVFDRPELGAANGSLSSGGVTMAKGSKGGLALSDRFAPPSSAVDTVVHIEVSREAVRNKVFENLLASEGLDNAPNSLRAVWSDGAEQVRSREMQRGNAAATPAKLREADKAQDQEALGSVLQKPGANFQPQAAQQDAAAHSGRLFFECDVSPEQLNVILKQIGEKPEAFSKPEVVASLTSNLGAQNYGYRSGGSGGGRGGFGSGLGGGQLAGGPDRRQVKADDKANKSAPGATVQSQGAPPAVAGTTPASPVPAARYQVSPAPGAAKQRVRFVLDVVDRLPAAGRTVGPPPAATATPATPATKQ